MKRLLSLLFVLSGITIHAQLVDICMVTVDSTMSHNIIIWDKPATGVDSIRIYRENILGIDELVDTWPNDSISEYHDYGANVNFRAWKYRIAPVYTITGITGPKSSPHRTIHIAAIDNLGIPRVLWSDYLGMTISSYECWRDTTSLSGGNDWDLMFTTTVPSDTDWNDNNPPQIVNYTSYKVNAVWPTPCTASRAINHNTTRSNKTQNIAPASVTEHIIAEVALFPNPASETLEIVFSSGSFLPLSWQIFDATGRVCMKSETFRLAGQYRENLNISSLPPGYYHFRVTGISGGKSAAFIKL
jgi:hypothetical protein